MLHFCVLGSGSTGNAALVTTPDSHVLIDIGFSPLELDKRLSGTGASWETLDAVILTHLHADHIKRTCFTRIARHGITFFCHAEHAEVLRGARGFSKLVERKLVRTYSEEMFEATETVRIKPIPVSHDCRPTFGFRIEGRLADGRWLRVGYLADLGECPDSTLREICGVDLLALEFNHDEHLERNSGRHPHLIARVMGRDGHLSNRKAAEVFRRVIESGHPPPKYLVQLHLSRECNRAELAYQAAQEVLLLSGAETQVFSSRQEIRGTMHRVM